MGQGHGCRVEEGQQVACIRTGAAAGRCRVRNGVATLLATGLEKQLAGPKIACNFEGGSKNLHVQRTRGRVCMCHVLGRSGNMSNVVLILCLLGICGSAQQVAACWV